MGRDGEDPEKCWRRQVWEASLQQMRGLAGAVVCAMRHLGSGFPSGHALLEGVEVDIKAVCSQDLKKMPKKSGKKQPAGMRWATKHECGELEDGVWVEPLKLLLPRIICRTWTTKDVTPAWKLTVEGDWTQKQCMTFVLQTKRCATVLRKQCQGCDKDERTVKHRLYLHPSLR